MIPLHALVLMLMGRFTGRLYVAYSSWYAIGTLASMQVPFVGFQPVRTSEHMAALGAFPMHVYLPSSLHISRGIRPVADRCFRATCPRPRVFEAVPRITVRRSHFCWPHWLPRNCWPYLQGLDCPLDGSILLLVGHGLRQEVCNDDCA
jgi:hypothetical protein